jgi:hypothetical protein
MFNKHKIIGETYSDGDFMSYFGNNFGHSKFSDFVLNCVLCSKMWARKKTTAAYRVRGAFQSLK